MNEPKCPSCGQPPFIVDTEGVCVCSCGRQWRIDKRLALRLQDDEYDDELPTLLTV